MATPFKEEISARSIGRVGAAVAQRLPGFDKDQFQRDAELGLDALELKARVAHVAAALDRHLPGPFPEAAAVLCDAAPAAELDGWAAWPLLAYVERHGLEHPEAALEAMACLTRYASAEFAIRPYLERYPDLTLGYLARWAASDDLHVRRLVSEGTRPFLPWGLRLTRLRRDPSPILPLLDRLRDDPEEYVRRSVANHLNDIGRELPDMAVAIASRWREEGGRHVDAVVRHGLRGLVKRGHLGALAVLGVDADSPLEVRALALAPDEVPLGGTLAFAFDLVATGAAPTRAIVDYVVYHRRANGAHSPKVFKLTTREMAPGETVHVERRHSFRPVTTRRYYPGEHRLEIQVNGRSLAQARFVLVGSAD